MGGFYLVLDIIVERRGEKQEMPNKPPKHLTHLTQANENLAPPRESRSGSNSVAESQSRLVGNVCGTRNKCPPLSPLSFFEPETGTEPQPRRLTFSSTTPRMPSIEARSLPSRFPNRYDVVADGKG